MEQTSITVKETYLARFERLAKNLQQIEPLWLARLRQSAIGCFADLGFPTTHDEEWRYTNVGPISRTPFAPGINGIRSLSPASIASALFPNFLGTQLVFVNARFAPHLSSVADLPPGAIVASLGSQLDSAPARLEPHLARYADYRKQHFAALNTAFMEDGAFIYIPKNEVIANPIHLVFLSTTQPKPTATHPRILLVAEMGSQMRLVENYFGLADSVYFTNAVTEIVQGEGSVVDYYKLQREGKGAFHIATVQIHQERSSSFTSHAISLGGALVRNDINAVLDAEGADCTLNGLYLIGGQQHEDNHTRIDHAKPNCSSRELYKGILSGKATGVFNGKIHVHKNAQKTDARQTNKNLILSEEATINTKPQLEIFADDVKCTHGATIGQLDEEAVFYMRSRGIGEEAARHMLTCAFARDILNRIRIEPIRNRLEEDLLARLERAAAGKGES